MIYGEDKTARFAREHRTRQVELNKMVPHQVFTWLPHQLEDGRFAWFQKVWRVAYDFTTNDGSRYAYHETNNAAWKFTKIHNVFRNNYKDDLREEVIKRLGA